MKAEGVVYKNNFRPNSIPQLAMCMYKISSKKNIKTRQDVRQNVRQNCESFHLIVRQSF